MDSQKSKIFRLLILLPLVVFFVSPSAAEDLSQDDAANPPDLVITEDSQLALKGRSGKAVIGSCQTNDPLWEGKIAIKNIGSSPVILSYNTRSETSPQPVSRPGALIDPSRSRGGNGDRDPDSALIDPRTVDDDDDEEEKEKGPPHLRVYVPNYIELQDKVWLLNDLGSYGQQLLNVEIGRGKNKCRNYDAPPVFDSRISGRRPAPRHAREPRGHGGPPPYGPHRGYSWQIKKIQLALIEHGYSLRADGDYGPQTAKAVVAYFKDRSQPLPAKVYKKPLPPETVIFLLQTLNVREAGEPEGTIAQESSDDCIKGVNYVPVYVEIDPKRAIKYENRSNNRVQFTVEIDCSNVAR